MSDRLISADALRQRMYHDAFETDTEMQRWDGGCWIRYKIFENALEDAPTVDAVKVVRCKDCRWQNTSMCWITNKQLLDDYDFCCGGLRRENDKSKT